ncbi:MAG TPA: hypothetical protein VE861_05505, partial [Gemmatimonadaceae bacterium]|nr:hypothetical protein [Gemmatimonadaceae bacterium]
HALVIVGPMGCTPARRPATVAPVTAAAASQAEIDEFVLTVRDMAAWAIVTPSAHIPVGGIQDAAGRVATVVGAQDARTMDTPDSVLTGFRSALGIAARKQGSRAIGLAYLARVVPPGDTAGVSAVVVEVEHRSGHRATVLYPYVFEDTEQPVFGAPFTRPGVLREFTRRR